ncbi:MAG: heavy metal-associated domain-containing protein [Moraxella sp.]|nr:heavy metal-associated domain-containing protein [Moraxella sp.]
MQKLIFTVDGMTCGGCASAIKKALSALSGVSGVEVALPSKQVTVMYDDKPPNKDAIVEAIEDAGFDVL